MTNAAALLSSFRHSTFPSPPARFPRSFPARMKKARFALAALLVLAVAVFVVFKKTIGAHVPAALLVPGETVLFVDLPNLPRTALRFPQTGLAKILAEPEMQKFLEKPRAAGGPMKALDEKLAQLLRLAPREVFVAVTSIEGTTPKWIAGFAFIGRKKDAAALLAEPRAEWKKGYPAGKSDIATHGGTEVETFAYGEAVLAEAFQGEWYLVANNVDLLHTTLDAAALPQGSPSALGTKEVFKKATAPLPAEGDALVFAQLGSLTERITSLLVASGQAPDPAQLAEIKRMQAVAWGTKLEGEQIRDTIFLLAPGGVKEPALALHALGLQTADTFLSYVLKLPEKIEMPDSAGLVGGYLPMLAPMEKALAEKGLTWADLGKAFGPELGVVADWPMKEGQPSAVLGLDVRDAVKARAFLDVFTGEATGTPPWGRAEKDGVTVFQGPPGEGLLPIVPVLALGERFLVFGLSAEGVESAVARWKQAPPRAWTIQEVTAPTAGFGELDMKTLFERGYGTMRPLLAMSLAFSADAGQYLDAGKLPGTETISRHLTPSIYSQSTTPDGTLVQSVGTLTFNQVLIAAISGGIYAAYPMIESTLSSGLKLDPTLLPMAQPPAPTPAETEPAAPPPPAQP